MADKKFIWLAGTCYPRRGPMLEKGKEYSVADYGEEIVAYWVTEKAAKYAAEKKSAGGEI
jgi:hypothetical protein